MGVGPRSRHVILCILVIYLSTLTEATVNTDTVTTCDNRNATRMRCGPVWCHHGDCYLADRVASCKCYRGWLRPGCEQCCALPCVHGSCQGTVHGGVRQTHCLCDVTHEGQLCDVERCLRQCVNGECRFVSGMSGPQQCACHKGFVGDLCEQPDPNLLPAWYWPTVGTVVTVGLILLLLGTVMPYVMWKKRALIVLRIHYFFQRYKEDESLPYDAFISCTSEDGEDREFLLETLCPTLEDSMGYRLCYGDRNFNPGESYVNSTCMAVAQSRRTLLLLSPAFMDDTWPIFEVQMAQNESLHSAHRIIPLVFRDLGEVTHPTLRNILSSLQCLKWPKGGTTRQVGQFWKKLKVLMPKLQLPAQPLRSDSRFEMLS